MLAILSVGVCNYSQCMLDGMPMHTVCACVCACLRWMRSPVDAYAWLTRDRVMHISIYTPTGANWLAVKVRSELSLKPYEMQLS